MIEFSGIMANPTYEKVLEGAKIARENEVDWILGIGGGSVMDCCKAVSLAAISKKDIWKEYWAKPGIIDFEPLPLGVIVTVAGTGSECNGGAVITNEGLKVKTGRDYPKCNPKFALMDPEYTYTVPVRQMVSGSFDILSHIMETYFSEPDVSNVSDDISEALMRNVIQNLRVAIKIQKTIQHAVILCGTQLWQKTVSSSLVKSVILNVIRWNIRLELLQTVIMERDLQCCIRFIIDIFINMV